VLGVRAGKGGARVLHDVLHPDLRGVLPEMPFEVRAERVTRIHTGGRAMPNAMEQKVAKDTKEIRGMSNGQLASFLVQARYDVFSCSRRIPNPVSAESIEGFDLAVKNLLIAMDDVRHAEWEIERRSLESAQ
jgi:hypothetical protein